jgi:hypothetical protein
MRRSGGGRASTFSRAAPSTCSPSSATSHWRRFCPSSSLRGEVGRRSVGMIDLYDSPAEGVGNFFICERPSNLITTLGASSCRISRSSHAAGCEPISPRQRNWKFESIPLQQRVCLSPASAFQRREARLCRADVRGWLGDWPSGCASGSCATTVCGVIYYH